jgi:hypothetical protein
MGILNCACICNNDVDIIFLKYKMSVDNVEEIVLIIQKIYRGFIFRKNFKISINSKSKNLIKNVKFDENWDSPFTKLTEIDFSMNHLTSLKDQILQWYDGFFSHNFTGQFFYVKESLYSVSKKDEFLNNFKILLLSYIYDNFDLGLKSKLIEDVQLEYEKEEDYLIINEKLLDRLEISSDNSASFIKKFTFSSNVGSVNLKIDSPYSTKKNTINNAPNLFIESPINIKSIDKKVNFDDFSQNLSIIKKINHRNTANSNYPTSRNQEDNSFRINLKVNSLNGFFENPKNEANNSYQRVNSILKNKFPPRVRSIKFEKSLEKTPEFNRKATKTSMRKYPNLNLNPYAEKTQQSLILQQNESSSFFDNYSLPSLFGQNGKTTLENLIDEFNKLMQKDTILVKTLDKEEGVYYEGTVNKKQGVKFGIGIQYMIDINKGLRYKYLGYFKNDKFHGYGIFSREDNYHYQGEFRNGTKCGYGMEISDKGSYKGLFHNDKYHGYGECTFKNKTIHRGCYNQSFKESIGFIEYEDKSRFIGHFLFNKMNSNGMFFWPIGHSYYGTWKDDKMHGKGKYMWKNGDIYLGGYENDLRHGEGEYFFSERNSLLKGTWINGKKNGKFKLYEGGEFFNINYRNDQQFFQN